MAAKKKKAKGTPKSVQAAGAAAGEFHNSVGEALADAGVKAEDPKPKKGSRRKQQELPNMTGKGVELNAVLEELCGHYNAAKVRRCQLTTEETRTREALLAGMKAEKVTEYAWDGKVFYIAHKDETDMIKEKKAKGQPDYEAVGSEGEAE